MASTTRFIASLVLLLALQTPSVAADDQQIVLNSPPTTAAPSLALDSVAKQLHLSLDGYMYHGCWTDTTGAPPTAAVRSIGPGRFTTDDSMTTSRCISYCSGPADKSRSAMRYAALLEGHTCHCSTSISPFFSRLDDDDENAPDTRCATPCAGNSQEACGGSGALSVYRLSDERGGPFFEEERFTTTTTTTITTTQRYAGQAEGKEDEGVTHTEQAEELQTGIAWSQYAGPSTWYGILAAITFVIAAVI